MLQAACKEPVSAQCLLAVRVGSTLIQVATYSYFGASAGKATKVKQMLRCLLPAMVGKLSLSCPAGGAEIEATHASIAVPLT